MHITYEVKNFDQTRSKFIAIASALTLSIASIGYSEGSKGHDKHDHKEAKDMHEMMSPDMHKMMMSPDMHKKMAKMHSKAADCLNKTKGNKACISEMKTHHEQMMGSMGMSCSMMGASKKDHHN